MEDTSETNEFLCEELAWEAIQAGQGDGCDTEDEILYRQQLEEGVDPHLDPVEEAPKHKNFHYTPNTAHKFNLFANYLLLVTRFLVIPVVVISLLSDNTPFRIICVALFFAIVILLPFRAIRCTITIQNGLVELRNPFRSYTFKANDITLVLCRFYWLGTVSYVPYGAEGNSTLVISEKRPAFLVKGVKRPSSTTSVRS